MHSLEGDNEEMLKERMQLVLLGWRTPCGSKDNWGWLKFSVVPTQNFTLEYIIASGYFADFFSRCCLLSHCSRLEVFSKVMCSFTLEYIIANGYFADFFSRCCLLSRCSRLEFFNKVMRATWTRNFLRSLKYLAFKKWRQVVHHWWTGVGHLEFPSILCLNFEGT